MTAQLTLFELQENHRLQAELTQLRQENNRLRKSEAQHKSDRTQKATLKAEQKRSHWRTTQNHPTRTRN